MTPAAMANFSTLPLKLDLGAARVKRVRDCRGVEKSVGLGTAEAKLRRRAVRAAVLNMAVVLSEERIRQIGFGDGDTRTFFASGIYCLTGFLIGASGNLG
jgi:hypothetical protein